MVGVEAQLQEFPRSKGEIFLHRVGHILQGVRDRGRLTERDLDNRNEQPDRGRFQAEEYLWLDL